MLALCAQYGGSVLEYTGSDVVIERVTCSKPLPKDLIVEVLTVGNVYPPQVSEYINLTLIWEYIHNAPQVREYINLTLISEYITQLPRVESTHTWSSSAQP